MPPPPPISFAAQFDAQKIVAAVVAAAGAAFLMFQGARKLTLQPPPATLSAHWKAEEKASELACERVASPQRPGVVLNPMRQNVV